MITTKRRTTDEEVALCKAWCHVSENSVRGNAMKNRGFWGEVIETVEKKGYDAITNKWKNRVPPRIDTFCVIIDNVERRNESGSCDLTVYKKSVSGIRSAVLASLCIGAKKYKIFETTLESTQGGFNLNDDVNGCEEEIREERPIGRNRAKKKASFSSSRFESLSVAGECLVELVVDKRKSIKLASWGKNEQQDIYS
ncbi:hypothetical protein Tco_0816294 [Tanacetum coccineum]